MRTLFGRIREPALSKYDLWRLKQAVLPITLLSRDTILYKYYLIPRLYLESVADPRHRRFGQVSEANSGGNYSREAGLDIGFHSSKGSQSSKRPNPMLILGIQKARSCANCKLETAIQLICESSGWPIESN
jgi:hypothetical protein